jgi:acyl-CoA thioester hydrolase
MAKTHQVDFRVYYEDTDAGGVVYYANYLKFAERARTELLRSIHINQSQLIEDNGIFFVVRHAALDLKKPAILDDLLTVNTTVTAIQGARIKMKQVIEKSSKILAQIHVEIACVNQDFRPMRLDPQLQEKFIPFLAKE